MRSIRAALRVCRPPGRYRATLEMTGGELRCGLEVARDAHGLRLFLASGDERIALTTVQVEPGKLAADLPDTGSRLTATISGDEPSGGIALAGAGGPAQSVPFKATCGQAPGSFAEPLTDNADAPPDAGP